VLGPDRDRDNTGAPLLACPPHMRKRHTGSGLIVFLVGLAVTPVRHASAAENDAFAAQKLALYVKPAVMRIYSGWTAKFRFRNQSLDPQTYGATGSGFFLTSDGYIATNAHVVQDVHEGAKKAENGFRYRFWTEIFRQQNRRWDLQQVQQLDAELILEWIRPISFVKLLDGEEAAYDIKEYGSPIGEGNNKDCAIIKISTRNAPTLPVGDSQKVQVQDRVMVVGYPGAADVRGVLDTRSGLEATVTEGTVSAVKATSAGDQVIQMSAAIGHGNSGGPALNQAGEVVGLVTFGGKEEVQGMNFLVSANTLSEYVRKAGAANGTSDINLVWRSAVDQFYEGHYTAAIEQLQEVEGLFPAHGEARKLLQRAREEKRAGKERMALGLPLMVGGGVALLAVVGLSIVLVRRRKPNTAGVTASVAPVSSPAQSGEVRARAGTPFPPVAPTVFAAGRSGTLTCSKGNLRGQRFALTPEGILIGRQHGVAHVVLNDGRVSAQHCWVRWEGNRLYAQDQGTTNGTFINDPKRGRISRAELNNGDVLIIADPDCCSMTVQLT
jgi:serine protease Do